MKCFQCSNPTCRTEYPTDSGQRYVQSVCDLCSWRSNRVKIPSKIPSVKDIPLEKTAKTNIFDDHIIYYGPQVDSMSQNTQCFQEECPDLQKYGTLIYSITCNVCMEKKLKYIEAMS